MRTMSRRARHTLPSPRPAARAFTLVELLVVIGIIALLISILLPSLSKSREQARRAACLSNLRQVHQALVLYANDNRDQVALGWRGPYKQFNSMVYSATAQEYVLFGRLYLANLMTEPRAFYCGAENDPKYQFNTPDNPWPPGPAGDPTKNVQSGFAMNPEFKIPDNLLGSPLPRLAKFKSRPIVADLMNTERHVVTRHGDGLNVLYADGAAQWQNRSIFVTGGVDCLLSPKEPFAATYDPFMDRLFTLMDVRR